MRKQIEITLLKISHFLQKYPREYYVYITFLFLALYVIYNLFSFTVTNHAYYKDLAIKQQTSNIKNELPRGNIYSINDSILATTVSLDDLAIDPALEGNKVKLGLFLRDIVYNELCYLKTRNECKIGLEKFLGVLELQDFKNDEIYIKDKIIGKIDLKINQTKLTQSFITDTLTKEQIFEIEKSNFAGVYINGTNLYVNPEEIKDEIFLTNSLSKILGFSFEEIKHMIRKRDLRYSLILNKISISSSENIKQKILEEKQSISRGFLNKEDTIGNFIILSSQGHRYYPEKDMGSAILGYVDNGGTGRYGIEGYYDNILKGKIGNKYSKKDIMGRPIDPIGEYENISMPGADITLTIDRNIQKAVEEIIDKDLSDYNANSISVIIQNPKTGEILAMASNPRFDPNNIGDVFELEKVTYSKYPNPETDLLGARVFAIDNIKGTEFFYNGKKIFLRELQREEYNNSRLEKYVFKNKKGPGVYKNEIIQDLYEPGSVFKPIVFSRAIDTGEITRFDMYKDDGYVSIDNFKIKNVSSQCLGYNTFQNAMNFSCNVGMIRIAQKIGPSIFSKYIEEFGIGRKTGIDLEGEVYGKLTPYERWSKAQFFTTSFGQGITVNILQLARVYSTLANGGIYYKPQIVKSIKLPDGKIIVNNPTPTHRVIKESTSKTMTKVLVEGVNKGVAKNGGVKGYSIAGKTGTAQIAYKGKYEAGVASTMGFYAGYGPAEDPRFVMIVKIERPRSSIYGGETVARTFSRITEYLFNYYAIPPSSK